MLCRRIFLGLMALLHLGCSDLPELSPPQFACTSNAPLDDGSLACGDFHWCVQQTCLPRLGCEDCGQDEGCEARFEQSIAAVQCSDSLTSTLTSTVSRGNCSCEEGLLCAEWLSALAEPYAPDLRYLSAPGDALGDEGDQRLCVPACSIEEGCPSDHTCRPLLGLDGQVQSIIAGCVPNRWGSTSSSAPGFDPTACLQFDECGPFEACRVSPEVTADHPVVGLGPSWGDRFSLVGRCTPTDLVIGEPPLSACTEGQQCASGICVQRRCRNLCNPERPEPACRQRLCVSVEAERPFSGVQVVDRVSVCEL